MTREEIAQELRDLHYNIGILERTEIGMGNAKDVLKNYQKVLRDVASIMAGIYELVPVIVEPK